MKVVVVGAGIAGLAVATYLTRKGHTVRVLEASNRIGGRAVTHTSRRGDLADTGTQYFHSNYVRTKALLADVGLEDRLLTIQGGTRFFDDRVKGGSFLVGHRLPWFSPVGVSGNLRIVAAFAALLRHRVDPFSLEAPAGLDDASAIDALSHPALHEFALRVLTIASADTEPEPANPSVLHIVRLVKLIIMADYLGLPGGIASLHEALAARLDITLESPVAGLVEEKNAIVGVTLAGSGEVVSADYVVVATTPPAAAAIVPEAWKEERAFLNSITIPSLAFPTFYLDRPLEKGVWSYMMQMGRSGHVGFALELANKNPAMAPSGKSIIQPWPRYPASKEVVGLSDQALADACAKELEDHLPGFSSWIEEVHVTRHPYAVPFSPVGHQRRALDFLERVDRRKGVSFCGDYFSGGYVEAALWSAERAARRI